MASRTYVQMWAKLNRMGRLPMPEAVRSKILSYSDFINDHPEEVEKVVQARLQFMRFLEKMGYRHISQYVLVISECMEIDKLFEHFMVLNNYEETADRVYSRLLNKLESDSQKI